MIPAFRLACSVVKLVALVAALGTTLAASPIEEYAALKKIHDTRLPAHVQWNSEEGSAWMIKNAREKVDLARAFIAAHPEDPLRWDALVLMNGGRDLTVSFLRDGSRRLSMTPEVEAIWNQKYYNQLEELLDSSDASRAAREAALTQLIDHYCLAVRSDVIDNPRKGIVPALLEWVNELYALDPRNGRLPFLYLRVSRMLDAIDPVRCRKFWEEKVALHNSAYQQDVRVRAHADGYFRLMRNQEGPATELWEYLKKIDPEVGNSSLYRGKAVLVFYLPVDHTVGTMLLEELYQKYHDKGLAIIQIAFLNRSNSAPLLQRDKAAVKSFVAEKGWPWPVIWEEAPSSQEFPRVWGQSISYVGLMIGRDGRIVREIPGEIPWEIRVQRELVGRVDKK